VKFKRQPLTNNPLTRPFPDREFSRETIIGMLRVSVFVFCALYFLRPNGMHVEGSFFMTCVGYAVVTFIVSSFYAWCTERVLGCKRSGDGWVLWKWVLDCGLLLALISMGNFVFYNFTVGWTAFSGLVLVGITVPTVLVGLFPVAFSGMAIQLRAERENQRTAGELLLASARPAAPASPPEDPTSRLVTLGESEFSLDPDNLLYCESRQNYVRCVFLRNGEVAEETIRATLIGIEAQLNGRAMLRCHRSYLVNPNHIRQARGNAQGLRLELVGTEEEVPVSRAYVSKLRERVL